MTLRCGEETVLTIANLRRMGQVFKLSNRDKANRKEKVSTAAKHSTSYSMNTKRLESF